MYFLYIHIVVIFVFIFIINHCLWLTGRPKTTEFLNPLFFFLCFCVWTSNYETRGFHCILINHWRCQCFLKCKYLCKLCVWVLSFPDACNIRSCNMLCILLWTIWTPKWSNVSDTILSSLQESEKSFGNLIPAS